jgi:hypothetical protein
MERRDNTAAEPDRAVAVTVEVDHLDGSPGVVAALLDHLDRRGVASTWFVPSGVDAALIDRLFYTGHEVAGLVPSPGDIRPAVRILTALDVVVAGVRVTPSRSAPAEMFSVRQLVEQTASTGLSYVSIPAGSIAGAELDRGSLLDEPPLTLLWAPTGSAELGSDPLAWLHGVQLAVGRIVEHGGFHELSVDLGAMDRPAGLSAVAEAVDLVSGLRRAERLQVDRLDRLIAALPRDR